MKKIIAMIVAMILSFFIAALFFASTGLINENGKFDRVRAHQIVVELETIPFIDITVPSEGNSGDFCSRHAECITPMEYLIQSNCPFTSLCIKNQCSVVCPLTYHDPDMAVSRSYPYTCESDADCNCSERGNRTIDCSCTSGRCWSVEG